MTTNFYIIMSIVCVVMAVRYYRSGSVFGSIWGSTDNKKPVIQAVKSNGFVFTTSKNDSIHIPNPQRGILISGSQGSGKTRSLIEPIIWQAAKKGYTGILYDYESPTLTRHVYSAYKKQTDVKDFYINFSDLSRSHRLNPLSPKFMTMSAYASDFSETILANLASEFIKQPSFFTRSSKSMLAAVIWYLREEKPAYCTLPHAVRMILSKDTPALLKRLNDNDEVQGMIASIETGATSANQNAGVIGTLQNVISVLNTPNIAWVLSGNDFNLDLNNPNEKKFLTVANTPGITTTLAPVISLIFTSALSQMNQQDQHKSVCVIDELPRIFIPTLDSIPATARKNLIAVILALQDFSQLEDKYGEKKAEVIISVLANQLYGKTTNVKTADRVSKLFGKYDKQIESFTNKKNLIIGDRHVSTTISAQQRPRVESQEVIDLNTGQFFYNLVETTKNSGKTTFKEHSFVTESMPSFSEVTEEEVKANYKRIKEEAEEIINGGL